MLLIGPIAVKVPRLTSWRPFLNGLLANIQERSFSRMADARLCPVLCSAPGGWLVIMKRARPMTHDEFGDFDFAAWADGLPVEAKASSLGWLNGRAVAIDYG